MSFTPPPPRPEARSLHGTLRPAEYPAFPGVADGADFNAAWQWCPDWCLANLAHTAYQARADLHATCARIGADDVQVFSHEGARAFCLRHGERHMLIFRGTRASRPQPLPEPLRRRAEALLARLPGRWPSLPAQYRQFLLNDVLADIDFVRVPMGQAQTHRGFTRELRKLWREIVSWLRALGPEGLRRCYVAGHSLGGAMSTITALRVPVAAVVTFGEPRPGLYLEREFKGEPATHRRYVNGNDLVPELPPSTWPFGYAHHGAALRVGDPDSREPLFDHSIMDYADRIALAAG